MTYEVGMIVEHPKRPEWGPGRILQLNDNKLTIYFRDLPAKQLSDAVKIIDTSYANLRAAASQHDFQLDNLPPYENGRFPTGRRLTLQESLDFFGRQFPLYFEDPEYFGDRTIGERAYKLEACNLFQSTLGDGQVGRLLASRDIPEIRARLLAVEGKLNLLSPYEKIAFRDALKSDSHLLAFSQALLEVLHAADISQQSFGKLIQAVDRFPAPIGRVATWPVLTLFPYVAQPHRHMFLKPEVTQKFADTLAFDLEYRTELNWETYSKLLIMCNWLLEKLHEYGARDLLDVQSFIWVVGFYKDRGKKK